MPRRTQKIALALAATAAAATALGACSKVPPEDRLSRANDAIVAHRYEAAEKEFNALLKEQSGDDAQARKYRRKALYRLGRLHYLFLNDPGRAVDFYKQAAATDPRAPLSFNALSAMGKIQQDTLRDYNQAVQTYQTLIARFPKHRNIDRYRRRLVESYFKMGNLSQVRAEGEAAVRDMPESRYADDILYLVAEAAMMGGDREAARSGLESLILRYPESEWVPQAHYTLGELFEGAGAAATALRHYEDALPGMKDSMVLKRKIESLSRQAR
jgi:TolA-binding protein